MAGLFSFKFRGRTEKKSDEMTRLSRAETQLREMLETSSYEIPVISGTEDVSKTSFATGFFIDAVGNIMTVSHAGERGNSFLVQLPNAKNLSPASFVGEIQTLDVMLLHVSVSEPYPYREFEDPEVFSSRRGWQSKTDFDRIPIEERVVGFKKPACTGIFDTPQYRFGVLQDLTDDFQLRIGVKKQETKGCSGSPVIRHNNLVVGMVRASSGDNQYVVDAAALQAAIREILGNTV